MSVYIRGMEMPKGCPCELIGDGYDVWCFAVGGIPARVKEYAECCQNGTRPSWCPLIPVPDHGRLIDADALTEHLGDVEYKGAIKRVLVQAPTIIPADEEEPEDG